MQTNVQKKVELWPEIKKIFKAPAEISIPDWVEQNVHLTLQSSNEAGPLRIARTPYTRGPLLALSDRFIEQILLCFARQTGKTEGILIPAMCYWIVQDPGPMVYFLPIKDKCEKVEADKIEPMFQACKSVQLCKINDPDEYTHLEKKFKAMTLSIVWGGSSVQTTTRSTRYLLRDEIDEQKKSVGKDGIDPMKGIEETTSNFPNRKIIDASTPTSPEGNIWQGLKRCRFVFEYWIPCPHCGTEQILYWENVKFGQDYDPIVVEEVAYYECEICHGKISNLDKISVLGDGEWHARLTPDPCDQIQKNIRAKIKQTISLEEVLDGRRAKKIGFHLPKWYSALYGGTLGIIAKEFLEAQKALVEGTDFAPMRTWRNFSAARPWETETIKKTELELMTNRIDLPSLICPKETIAITCGIDRSEKGFWYVVMAWVYQPGTNGYASHLIHYGVMAEDWDQLEGFILNTTYAVHESPTARKPILVTGFDIGGGEEQESVVTQTAEAYSWLRRMRAPDKNLRVFGTKGLARAMKRKVRQGKIDKMPGPKGEPISGGLWIWEMDTSELKKDMWFHLQREPDKLGRFTFHSETDLDYMRHLLSEKYLIEGGKWVWKKKGRNHWLDATIINFALMDNECYGLQMMSFMGKATQRRIISKGVV